MLKSLIVIFILSFSSVVKADWTVLSCIDKNSSVIIEFDKKLNKVRFQNDNNRIYDAVINDYSITWNSSLGVVNSNERVYFYDKLDRVTGIYTTTSKSGMLISNYTCSVVKDKKF